MQIKILIRVRHFFIKDGTEFEMPHFIISKDRGILNSLFSDDEYVKDLGTLHNMVPYNEHDFIYYKRPIKRYPSPILINKDLFDEQNAISKMVASQANRFLSALWYIRDNSVSIHDTTCSLVEYMPSLRTSMHFDFFTNYKGEFQDSFFTIEELNRVKEIVEMWQKLCPKLDLIEDIDEIRKRKDMLGDGLMTKGLIEYEYNSLNRLERASLLLDTARSQHYLPLKIAFFIPLFECLFVADSGGETQQKICERVAFYLSEDKKERRQIFDDLKDGYVVRSKFFHGDRLPSKFTHEKLIATSKSVDQIARTVLLRIVTQDHAIFLQEGTNKNDFESYLNKLIFQ